MLKPPARPGALPPLETPQLSPKGYVEQIVGIMNVSVSYSRSGMRGRKIFGGLVPYGQVWRTGANEPTTVWLSDHAKLEGHDVPAGTYSLFTVPGEKEWTIIINKKTTGNQHDPNEDLISFKVRAAETPLTVETLTINISDINANFASIELAWERTVVKFRLEFDVDSKVMASIQKVMENPFADVAHMFFQSASYYFSSGRDPKLALEWVSRSLEINKNPYWVWRLKSQIQAKLNDFEGAVASAETSTERAKIAGNHQFAKFNADAIAEWKGRMK